MSDLVKSGVKLMTKGGGALDWDTIVVSLFDGVEDLIDKQGELIKDRIAELEARLSAIEARLTAAEAKAVTFKGIHSRGVDYSRGDLVLRGGVSWLALRDNPGLPGTDVDGWLLVSKGTDK